MIDVRGSQIRELPSCPTPDALARMRVMPRTACKPSVISEVSLLRTWGKMLKRDRWMGVARRKDMDPSDQSLDC